MSTRLSVFVHLLHMGYERYTKSIWKLISFMKHDIDLSSLPPAIAQFLGEADDKWLATRNDEHELKQKAVHFLALGVHPEYQGNGIAQAMIRAGISHSKEIGYSLAYTSTAAIETQRIYEKLGFKKVVEKRLSEFDFKGERVFKDVKELESLIVFEKNI